MMANPEPRSRQYPGLMTDITDGKIKLPQFQRNYVWDTKDSAGFLDSILRGYPIGTFILWVTKERLQSIRNIGNAKLPATRKGESVQYVLDGQQRLATLYACIKGLMVQQEGKKNPTDYKEFYVDLEEDPDDPESIVVTETKPTHTSIKFHQLLDQDLNWYPQNYPNKKHQDRISHYVKTVQSYAFSIIEINNADLAKAVKIFQVINTGGTKLTAFEIMVAKTYDENKHFNLREKYDDLNVLTENRGYTIPDQQILQLISIILSTDCKTKTILTLSKNKIINLWPDVEDAVKMAIESFKRDFQIGVSRLLPSVAFFVTFGYFFYRTRKQPTVKQLKLLKEYFWKASLSERYSGASETLIAQDKNLVDGIIQEKPQHYGSDFNFKYSINDIKWWRFNTGNTITKSILCLFASKNPLRFDNNSQINLQNDWLKIASSKNYHHFFPKSYLKKRGVAKAKYDVITNITLVDDYLNKAEIKAKAPSVYMKKFEQLNSGLAKTMSTHIIKDLKDFGVWKDDYDKFIEKRGNLIFSELMKLIV